MSHLLRSHAPIAKSGWELLDEEATQRLSFGLAARRLVDFSGPHGWEYSATNLGRVVPLKGPPAVGVTAVQRKVLPLVELRADFGVSRAELSDHERGAQDVDLGELDAAAHQMVVAENAAVFHGFAPAGIAGITERTPQASITLGKNAEAYPSRVAMAVEALRQAGIGGPYGLALGPKEYTHVVETAEHGGYLLLDHLKRILGGSVVWAPGVKGAVVLSLRGGDFLFESGGDLAIGYNTHDAKVVQLYLEESFSFRVVTPEAAVALT
jgi:uncharacterized linocin/CFP29 family protein